MRKSIVLGFAGIGVLVTVLGMLQIHLLVRHWLFLVLAPFIMLLVILFWNWFYHAQQKPTLTSKIVLYGLLIVHMLPAILQLVGVGEPRVDTLIVGVIGVLFYWGASETKNIF